MKPFSAGGEDRDQADAAADVLQFDLLHQVLQRHRALILVAVIGAERSQALAGAGLWTVQTVSGVRWSPQILSCSMATR